MGKARKTNPKNKTLAVRMEHNIVVMNDAVVG